MGIGNDLASAFISFTFFFFTYSTDVIPKRVVVPLQKIRIYDQFSAACLRIIHSFFLTSSLARRTIEKLVFPSTFMICLDFYAFFFFFFGAAAAVGGTEG